MLMTIWGLLRSSWELRPGHERQSHRGVTLESLHVLLAGRVIMAERGSDEGDTDTRLNPSVQMSGLLDKMATNLRKRWRTRFFMLKDGFLFWYAPSVKSCQVFDFHPKVRSGHAFAVDGH